MWNDQQAQRLYKDGERVSAVVTIQRTAAELYEAWMQLTDLSRFIEHVLKVEIIDAELSRWTFTDDKGKNYQWTAQIIRDEQGRKVSWRSSADAQYANAGTVAFRELPFGRGCEMTVTIEYVPGSGIAGMFAKSDEKVTAGVQRALWRFRNVMEAGEVPTVAGQPRGEGEDSVDPPKPADADVRDVAMQSIEGSRA